METFFQPGEQRASRVNELFGRIARRYDLINDVQSFGLHRYWKRRLIDLAQAAPGVAALDLCCGTGDFAFALARKGARVIGVDFSQPMLEIAERKRRQSQPGNNNLTFLLGDAQRLAFADRSFDIVTIGYGLRNLQDWEVGLREMQRVAAPGGRLLVLEFGKPENVVWRAAYFSYLKILVPLIGLVFCGNAAAYAYILQSLSHYPAQAAVAARMSAMGLKDVRVLNLLGGAMSILYAQKALGT